MRVLEDMCELLEDELKVIAKKGDISPTELDSVYKSVDIIKDIETIKAKKKAEEQGYSNASYAYDGSYGSYRGGSYRGGDGMSSEGYSRARRGRDGDNDGRYSERRGRDSMGRYTSRDGGSSYEGYSRAEEKEQLLQQMQEMQRQINQMN